MEPKFKQEKVVAFPCDCGCCHFLVTKTIFYNGETDYDISVVDSYYDHDANSLFGRLKRAAKALFGKKVYFNDVYMQGDERFDDFLDDLHDLRAWEGPESS